MFTDAYDPVWDDDPAWDNVAQLNAIIDEDPGTCVELNTAEHVNLWLAIDPAIFPEGEAASIDFTVGYDVISAASPPTELDVKVCDTNEAWVWQTTVPVTGDGTLSFTIDGDTVEAWPPLYYYGPGGTPNPLFRDFANEIKGDGVLSIFRSDGGIGAVCITGATMTVTVWRNLAINPSGEQSYNRAWAGSNGNVETSVEWGV